MGKKEEQQNDDDEEPEDDDLEIVLDDPRTRGAAGADASAGAGANGAGDDSDDDFDVQLDEAAVASAVPVPAARAEGEARGVGGGGGAASAAPAAPPKPRGPRMPSYPGALERVGERERKRGWREERALAPLSSRSELAQRVFTLAAWCSRRREFSRRPVTCRPAPMGSRERALSFGDGWRVWDGAKGTGTEVERSL